MPFLNDWASADRRILLSFSEPVLAVFEKYVQVESLDNEAGGLLLGTIRGSNILVGEATVPTVWDKRLRYFFERMPFGHYSIAKARWKNSDGTVRYIGEWHTHPEDHPHPSSLDRIQWNKLSQKREDKRSMLAVIVGRKDLYVELVPNIGIGQIMTSLEPCGDLYEENLL
jgi:integrative and conjugative element protein (TIGR02256 family)